MIGLELRGLEDLERSIDAVEKQMEAALVVAVNKGAAVVQKAAKANIKPTGDTRGGPDYTNLRKHVKRAIFRRKPDFVGVVIGPAFRGFTAQQRSYYGAWVEEGHRKAKPGKRLARLRTTPISAERLGKAWKNKYGSGTIGEMSKLEHGTSKVPPHPWLRPGLDENKARAQAAMVPALRKALDKKLPEGELMTALRELAAGGD